MTNISELRRSSAVARLEGLRALGDERISKILDNMTDISYLHNQLTDRERICRACNELQNLSDVSAKQLIREVVQSARTAFDLVHYLHGYGNGYAKVTDLAMMLNGKHERYNVDGKLGLYNRSFPLNTPQDYKADAAKMVAELLVIGANAEDQAFLNDLQETIASMTAIILSWL